ncbi:MAG: c-type cytochrome [Pseudomonadota bacterium]|nr:c-type cytochrome [Pseudomonadota bacterium]
MRLTTLIAVLLMAFAAVIAMHNGRLESRLLRADPNRLPGDPALLPFAVGRGKSLFEANCANCHGALGQGAPARGIPNLADTDWLYGSGLVDEIERVVTYGIRSGHPKAWNLALMPAYATAQPSAAETKIPPLSPGGIRDVVEFLLKVQGQPANEEAVVRGARIYSGVGGCWDCHSGDAQGDTAIGAPNLTDRITLYGDGGRQSLFDSIAYGHHGVCPAWIKRISPAGIREISLYVYSLSHHLPPVAAKAE